MLYTVTAVVRPALTLGMERAALIPTEPHAIAVYALVAGSLILVWLGNRGSGDEDTQAEGEAGEEDAPPSTDDEARESGPSSGSRGSREQGRSRTRASKRGRKKLTRAQKRRRGHINWIQ